MAKKMVNGVDLSTIVIDKKFVADLLASYKGSKVVEGNKIPPIRNSKALGLQKDDIIVFGEGDGLKVMQQGNTYYLPCLILRGTRTLKGRFFAGYLLRDGIDADDHEQHHSCSGDVVEECQYDTSFPELMDHLKGRAIKLENIEEIDCWDIPSEWWDAHRDTDVRPTDDDRTTVTKKFYEWNFVTPEEKED